MYFFSSNLKSPLVSDEVNHLITCRIKSGEKIFLTNLQGRVLKVEITKIFKGKQPLASFKVLEEISVNKPLVKVLFQAKIDKLYLEKLVEILPIVEVSKLVLFPSKNSVKTSYNFPRIKRILKRSCLQTENPFLTEISEMSFQEALSLMIKQKTLVLEKNPNFEKIKNSEISTSCYSAVVGPEGGFTEEELKIFEGQGLKFCSLGQKVFPAWLAGFSFFQNITNK